MSREQLVTDAMRLEDKELEARKDLWLIVATLPNGEETALIVEAVTGPGALGVADTLDLIDGLDPGDLKLHGPHDRGCWPEKYWYRWLTGNDVAQMEAEFASQW